MANITTTTERMTVQEYRKRARGYISRIVPLQKTGNMDDLAYAMYLRRFFFGYDGTIVYTYNGNTWKKREAKRELPMSKEKYLAQAA